MSKYSVVHWGPIKYFNELWRALAFARTCWRRKGFYCMGTWWKLRRTDKLRVVNLETDDVVQTFDSNTQ